LYKIRNIEVTKHCSKVYFRGPLRALTEESEKVIIYSIIIMTYGANWSDFSFSSQ